MDNEESFGQQALVTSIAVLLFVAAYFGVVGLLPAFITLVIAYSVGWLILKAIDWWFGPSDL